MALLKRLLLTLAPLVLIAAAPAQAVPDRQPAESDLARHNLVVVYDWLRILPAPHTPSDFLPPAGARVAWPLRGVLTQPFGCTGFELERSFAGCPNFHTGLDIAQNQGVPIQAAAAGLAYPFQDDQGYGNHVLIQHAAGYSTVYGHMVQTNVSWGQPVRAGDLIGWVGSTGNSTGPHLHFEVRFAGAPLDPQPYLDGSPADPFPLLAGWPGAPRDDWRGRR